MRYLLENGSRNECAAMETAAHFLPWEEQKILVTGRSGVCVNRRSAKLGGEQRSTPTSVPGPPSWKNSDAQHREVLTIPRDPPGNEPDVTQNGKGRQCVSAKFASCTAPGNILPSGKNFGGEEIKKCNNALARGASCGRLASFAAPLM